MPVVKRYIAGHCAETEQDIVLSLHDMIDSPLKNKKTQHVLLHLSVLISEHVQCLNIDGYVIIMALCSKCLKAEIC